MRSVQGAFEHARSELGDTFGTVTSGPEMMASRRQHLRAEMESNIRRCAYEQIAVGGAEALSMNAIAKTLGVSGPALYRYFASRDELLAELVMESWEDLAARMESAAHASADIPVADRFRAEARAYRQWALGNPSRYRLLNGTRFGTGVLDPGRIIPAAHRSMLVVLAALGEIIPVDGVEPVSDIDPELASQLTTWAASRPADPGLSPDILLRGVLAQTRIHGILSLEIEGYFSQLGIDAELLFANEVESLMR